MEYLRESAYILCALCIAGGIFIILAPQKWKKSVRFITGLVFLITVVSFFGKTDFDDIFADSVYKVDFSSEISDNAREFFEKAAAENVKEVIKSELERIDINEAKIDVRVKADDFFNVRIESADIKLSEKYSESIHETEMLLAELKIKGKVRCIESENK